MLLIKPVLSILDNMCVCASVCLPLVVILDTKKYEIGLKFRVGACRNKGVGCAASCIHFVFALDVANSH